MLGLHGYRFAIGEAPAALSILLNGVIELEGYGFDLNSSMKFTWGIIRSIWRVNLWCPETQKIGESALALIAKAAFDAKAAHCSSGFRVMVATSPIAYDGVITKESGRSGMQSFEADVHNRITALVTGILTQNALPAALAPDTRLVDAGLTSMDMVNLMLAVEAEFDFTIPQDEITPENFQSLETLRRMVLAQLQPTAA